MNNIEFLKLSLYSKGIEITQDARTELFKIWGTDQLTTGDYATTNGITLKLFDPMRNQEVWVNTPFIDYNYNFVTKPIYQLVTNSGSFFVVGPNTNIMASPIPVPAYHGKLNQWGEPFTQYVNTHADRARISPVDGCAITCTFCDLPYTSKYRLNPIDRMMDALRVAIEDPQLSPRHVLISGGTPKVEDYSYLQQVYETTCNYYPDLEIDVMMVPYPDLLDLNFLKRIGIYGLSINIEVFDEQIARKITPRKYGLSRECYLEFIEQAVEVFGVGRVRSSLLVGLESIESTLEGIRALAERGCDPVLSPFRPDPATPLRSRCPPDEGMLRDVVTKAKEIVYKYQGVELGPRCRPCSHNAVP